MHGRAKQIDIIDKWKRGENNDATKLKTNMHPKEKENHCKGLVCVDWVVHRLIEVGMAKKIFRMAMKTLGGYIYEKLYVLQRWKDVIGESNSLKCFL